MLDIALVQFEPKFGRINENVEAVIRVMRLHRADVYVLPELFCSGYTFASKSELEDLAIDAHEDEALEPIREFSRTHDVAVCGGYAEKSDGKFYNSSFFMDGGDIIANYRKTHLFWNEKTLFEPGDTGFGVFEYRDVKIGMMICFDWYFPEAARSLMLNGAEIILHPANLVLSSCQKAMFARALENRVFIATVNRIGTEINGELKNTFTGGSQMVSYKGEYLVQLSADKVGIEVVSVDPRLASDKSMTPMNDLLGDRRPEMYESKEDI